MNGAKRKLESMLEDWNISCAFFPPLRGLVEIAGK